MFLFPYQHRETILISWGDFSKTNIFIFDFSASTAAQRALLRLSFRTLIPTQNVTFLLYLLSFLVYRPKAYYACQVMLGQSVKKQPKKEFQLGKFM